MYCGETQRPLSSPVTQNTYPVRTSQRTTRIPLKLQRQTERFGLFFQLDLRSVCRHFLMSKHTDNGTAECKGAQISFCGQCNDLQFHPRLLEATHQRNGYSGTWTRIESSFEFLRTVCHRKSNTRSLSTFFLITQHLILTNHRTTLESIGVLN